MKVFVDVPFKMSGAMTRVVRALTQHAPASVTIVDAPEKADLEVLHVIEWPGTLQRIEELRAIGRRFALIQYCFRSTHQNIVAGWLPLWKDAVAVWSYYDLLGYARDEGIDVSGVNLIDQPLGVDGQIFHPMDDIRRKFLVNTSGYVPESECVLEVMAAAARLNQRVFHLGPPDARYGEHVHTLLGIDDSTLGQMYNRCQFVSGLRRGEGFELPAAEGLLCGAVPILFDQDHYRRWYHDLGATFIEEFEDTELLTDRLVKALETEPQRPTIDQLQLARERFDWAKIASVVWEGLGAKRRPSSRVTRRKRVLWVGDAAVSTGFSRVTHGVCDVLKETWDVSVLGINYYGDPHPYPYPIYPCKTVYGGDLFGIKRLPDLVKQIKPEVVVLLTDVWNVPIYVDRCGNALTVGHLAVDGLNSKGRGLNSLRHAVFWTEFGLKEARLGGYVGPATVIPLGVDTEVFYPIPRDEARARLPFRPVDRERLMGSFILGNINRNQPRKRLDLTIAYFAEWIKSRCITDAYLLLHVAPTGEISYDLHQLSDYFGVSHRVIVIETEIGTGLEEAMLADIYNSMDAVVTTTQGEGWGLPIMEALACAVPCLVPNWAALGEWPGDAVLKVECTSMACTPNGINAIGGIADREAYLAALDQIYGDKKLRETLGQAGLAVVRQPKYRWEAIGQQFMNTLEETTGYEAFHSRRWPIGHVEATPKNRPEQFQDV